MLTGLVVHKQLVLAVFRRSTRCGPRDVSRKNLTLGLMRNLETAGDTPKAAISDGTRTLALGPARCRTQQDLPVLFHRAHRCYGMSKSSFGERCILITRLAAARALA